MLKNFPGRVLQLIQQIPCGRVATYGQIAALAGAPRQARFVGRILHQTHDDALPWHRVINCKGQISLPKFAGYEVQRQLLIQEGVDFDANDRVDLQKFGWQPDFSLCQQKIS